MILGFQNLKCLPLAACALFACLVLEGLAQQEPVTNGQEKESSGFISSLALSNLNTLTSEADAKRDLSDAYKFKKPDSFNPTDPFESSMPIVRTPLPTIHSKRLMDLLQKRKDWVFLEPNEKEFGLTAEDIFGINDKNTKEEDEEEDMTPMERFYHRKDRRDGQDGGRTNLLAGADETTNEISWYNLNNAWLGQSDSRPDSPDAGFSESSGDASDSTFRKPPALAGNHGLFGSGRAQISGTAAEDAALEQKARVGEFKKLLDTYYPSSSDQNSGVGAGGSYDPANPWSFSSPRPVAPGGQIAPPAGPSRNPFSPLPSAVATPGMPQTYESMSTPSGFSSLTPALPAQEDRRLTMPQPNFSRPKSGL